MIFPFRGYLLKHALYSITTVCQIRINNTIVSAHVPMVEIAGIYRSNCLRRSERKKWPLSNRKTTCFDANHAKLSIRILRRKVPWTTRPRCLKRKLFVRQNSVYFDLYSKQGQSGSLVEKKVDWNVWPEFELNHADYHGFCKWRYSCAFDHEPLRRFPLQNHSNSLVAERFEWSIFEAKKY